MVNKPWGDFYGKLTTKKWASITKVSTDTALRDINDLVEKGILVKSVASGRSQSYELVCLERQAVIIKQHKQTDLFSRDLRWHTMYCAIVTPHVIKLLGDIQYKNIDQPF